MMATMNIRQRRFVNEYAVDGNATQAAIRAGYSEKTAGVQGHELLKVPKILEAIAEREAEVAVAAGLSAEWVLRQWHAIATADPNELMYTQTHCCRHCHGYDHRYQWSEAEYSKAVDDAINACKEPPDGMGGFGYDANAEPAQDCPECFGKGLVEVHITDSRKLSGAARKLYAGAEKTRSGIKVKTRDQDAALNNISKYLGMVVDRKELSGPGGTPIAMAHLSAEDFTDDQLAAMLGATDDDD